jgi:hypothetical protein
MRSPREIFGEMGASVSPRNRKKIKLIRKEIAGNMEERGMFYDDEMGWIRHDRVQEAIDMGLIRSSSDGDCYFHASTTRSLEIYDREQRRRVMRDVTVISHDYELGSVENFLRGGVLKMRLKTDKVDGLGL